MANWNIRSISEIKAAAIKKIIKMAQSRALAAQISSLGSAKNERLQMLNEATNYIH